MDEYLKVVIDDESIKLNEDGSITMTERTYPEKLFKIDGILYMKYMGDYYELTKV